jgi:hypothetical protein
VFSEIARQSDAVWWPLVAFLTSIVASLIIAAGTPHCYTAGRATRNANQGRMLEEKVGQGETIKPQETMTRIESPE